MAWTASINNISKNQGNAQVVVAYTNGVDNVTETYSVASPSVLKQTVINKIAQLQAVDDFVSTTTSGPIDTTVTTPVVTTPTPAQVAQTKFIADYATLKQMKQAITAGLKTAQDADVVAQIALVKSEFLPAYISLIT